MARRSKPRDFALAVLGALLLLPLLLAQWIHDSLGIPAPVSLALLALGVIGIVVSYFREQNKKARAIQIANIDAMSGVEFEQYLQKLLTAQGQSVHMTRASGDLGVDLIASRNGSKVAVQVKRQEKKVSRRAVSDAVAGMQHYRCQQAMVITNNYFSAGAITLARSTNCVLVNRNELSRWILEFQNRHLDGTKLAGESGSIAYQGDKRSSNARGSAREQADTPVVAKDANQVCPQCGNWNLFRRSDGRLGCYCGYKSETSSRLTEPANPKPTRSKSLQTHRANVVRFRDWRLSAARRKMWRKWSERHSAKNS